MDTNNMAVSQLQKSIKEAFKFGESKLRVYGTIDQPWVCARDVCKILEYKDTHKAVKEHVESKYIKNVSEIYMVGKSPTIGYHEKTLKVINEPGLYCLIFGSKMTKAKEFRDWVFEEVLPNIRKKGYYVALNITDEKVEQLQQELKKQRELLEKANIRNNRLEQYVQIAKQLEMNEVFYIATTVNYAAQNRFKFGGIAKRKDLRTRLASYNTGRAEGDLVYYCQIFNCHSYKQVEAHLNTLVRNFKDKQGGTKEMIYMHYTCFVELVEFLIDNHTQEIDFINENARRFIDTTIGLEPVVPEPISFEDTIVVSRQTGGTSQVIHKINVADWSDEKIQTLVKELLNTFVAEKLNLNNYDFNTAVQKQKIQWKEFKDILTKKYDGKTKMQWREIVKKLLFGAQQLSIGWRG